MSRLALLLVTIALVGCSKPAQEVQADGCPKDLIGAQGASCKDEGKTCSGGSNVRLIMCSNGKWVEMNMPPMGRPPPAPASSAP